MVFCSQTNFWENLYHLALSTGMRQGEILGLRWHNVDWDTNSIIVVEQVQWADGSRDGKPGYVFTSPKTEKSKRRIVVGAETMRRLQEDAATMIEGTLPGNDAPMSDEALPVAELDNFETELL